MIGYFLEKILITATIIAILSFAAVFESGGTFGWIFLISVLIAIITGLTISHYKRLGGQVDQFPKKKEI